MFSNDAADTAYAAPPVLTVTALNQQVARLLERTFPLTWIGGDAGPTYAKAPGSDAEAVFHGFASVTPLRLDLGCPETLARQADFDAAFNG